MEPIAAMAQRAGKNAPKNCSSRLFSEKMMPEKITCGMRMIGIKLVARSVFGASAESANPVIKPASEVSTREIYISSTGGSMVLCWKGAR